MRLCNLVILSLFFTLPARAQRAEKIATPVGGDESKQIFDRYLRTTDSAEWKINELISLAEKDEQNKPGAAMIKLQAALILEKNVKPGNTTFALNLALGHIFMGINPAQAIFFYRKALAISSATDVYTPGQSLQVLGIMAGQFVLLQQTDSALAYYRFAVETARTKVDNISLASATNNLGIFYTGMGEHDSAVVYYNTALQQLGGLVGDTVLYCAINDNIAGEKEWQNNFAGALQTYRFNDSVYFARNQPARYTTNKIKLLNALAKTQPRPGEIEKIITSANEYINVHYAKIKLAEVLKFYSFAEEYFFDAGNKSLARNYRDLYTSLRDSMEKQTTRDLDVLSVLLSTQSSNFKSEFEIQQLLVEKQKTTIIIAALLIITGLAIIGFLILYIRKRKQEHRASQLFAEEQLKIKHLEAEAALYDLEMKKKDLVNVVLHNTQVYENNRKLIDQLNDITHKGNDMGKSLKSLLIDLQNHGQVGDSPIAVQQNIDSVNAGFYEKLKQRFPDLTPAEAELCGYIRINLSNKDISVLKNIGPNSIKVSKNRLKKKLRLLPDDDLYEFVNQL